MILLIYNEGLNYSTKQDKEPETKEKNGGKEMEITSNKLGEVPFDGGSIEFYQLIPPPKLERGCLMVYRRGSSKSVTPLESGLTFFGVKTAIRDLRAGRFNAESVRLKIKSTHAQQLVITQPT